MTEFPTGTQSIHNTLTETRISADEQVQKYPQSVVPLNSTEGKEDALINGNSSEDMAPFSSVSWCNGAEKSASVHCPLCDYDKIFPKWDNVEPSRDESKLAFIFLDIDGVLIRLYRCVDLSERIDETTRQLFPHKGSHSGLQQNIALARHFDSDALKNLHTIIEQVEESGRRPLIVLSTGWRHTALLDQQRSDIYVQHKFSKYICGKTSLDHDSEFYLSIESRLGFDFYENAKKHYNISLDSRGDAIEYWLRDHQLDPHTTNFAVIDDDHQASLRRFGAKHIETKLILKSDDAQKAIDVLCKN